MAFWYPSLLRNVLHQVRRKVFIPRFSRAEWSGSALTCPIIVCLSAVALLSCGSQNEKSKYVGDTVVEVKSYAPVADSVVDANDGLDVVAEAADDVSVAAPMQERRQTASSQPQANRKVEKIYVHGYDGNGQVWGYVSLKGDRGTGVIHDAEENHFAVTCSRHGDEVFAVDQNGRQYILKM